LIFSNKFFGTVLVLWIRKPGVSRNSNTFLALYFIVQNGTIKISFSFPVLENGTVQGKNPVPYHNRETKNPYRRSLIKDIKYDSEEKQ